MSGHCGNRSPITGECILGCHNDSPRVCRHSLAFAFRHLLPEPSPPRSAAELAAMIEDELTNPGLPPGWEDFSDDEWRVVVAALRKG